MRGIKNERQRGKREEMRARTSWLKIDEKQEKKIETNYNRE